jgi:hypothetical protein
MANNYQNHLWFELRKKESEAIELNAVASICEQVWRNTKKVRREFEHALARLIQFENSAAETFRIAHSHYTDIRQEIGELQEELFPTGEEEESWH